MNELRIGVAGAGLIGKRHIEAIDVANGVALACIVDPSPMARSFAGQRGADWYASLADMFASTRIDGIILATPNQVHVEHGLACVARGCPVLVEKPIGIAVNEAEKLVKAAKLAGVALLTGHHRRHNGLVRKAKSIIDEGVLGTLVAVQGTCWFHKPDDYFDAEWRRQPGAGPVFLNLVHDIDLLAHLCGDIKSVQALESNNARSNEVEDTAAILLRFASGALGTINVSDAVVAPWSWELTAAENPVYPTTDEACYLIGGSHASLSLPDLTLWRHQGARSWWSPINGTKIPFENADPLIAQIHQFAAVIRGQAAPLVSGDDGLTALRVVEAVKRAAATGKAVKIAPAK